MADKQSTVSFDPPFDDGGSTITSYTVTSIPDGITQTGLSSPITVTGLTNGTSYTFTVHATNIVGDSVESDASNAVIPSGVDIYFGDVVLLLHGDGANGSTTIIDSSSVPKVPYIIGSATISTEQSKFNGSSIKFPKNMPTTYTGVADFNLNIPSWTIEMWYYELPDSSGSLVSRRINGSSSGWVLTTSGVRALINGSGFEGQQFWTPPSFNVWHHIAWVKDSTELRVYVDGTLVHTKTGVNQMYDGGNNVVFGLADHASENPFSGYLDDVRWTKGIARYTTDFIPLSSAFPNS